MKNSAGKFRNPWFPIEPILAREDPLTPVFLALDRMEANRPSYFGSPTYAARHDRDHLVASFAVASKLRRSNYGPLTYRPDNTGHLQRTPAQRWKLVIPQHELKNAGSMALPPNGEPLEIELDHEDPALYQAIDRWIAGPGCSRRILHGDDCGDWLFPGDHGKAISGRMIAEIIYSFSARYLAECPWNEHGIAGVKPFGPHAIRDFVATHMIKLYG